MSSAVHILVTERFSENAFGAILGKPGVDVKRSKEYANPTAEEMSTVEILICRSKTRVTEKFLNKSKKLKLVITTTSGFDHIDLMACKERGIRVCHTPDANAPSAAELTLSLALSSLKKLDISRERMKQGDWNRSPLKGKELNGRTWGIVGLGRVGTHLARLLEVFNVKLIAYDPYVDDSTFKKLNVERVGLSEIFRQSSIVSIHVPNTTETHNFVSEDHLRNLGEDGLFINTSRGSIVRTQTLLTVLKESAIGALALDVFEREPIDNNSDLFNYPNVVMTPHIGGNTVESQERAGKVTQNIVDLYLEGADLLNELPPKAQWFKLK